MNNDIEFEFEEVESCECVGSYCDEHVYDIEMSDDTHTFICNDILVHNSAYISLNELVKACGITDEQATHFIMFFDKHILQEYLAYCFDYYATVYNCPVNLEEFELEKVARSVIMLKKKKYVMDISWKEPDVYVPPLHSLVIKGVEIIKGTSSAFCRKEMKDFVIWLLDNINKEIDIKYSDIVARIKEIKMRFVAAHPDDKCMNQSISDYEKYVIDDTGSVINYNSQVTTTMAAKASARYNNALHTKSKKYKSKYNFIHSGDKIKIYYMKNNNEDAFAFLPGNYPSEFAPEMDVNKQFKVLILNPLNRFIVAMGYPEVRENLRYTTSLF